MAADGQTVLLELGRSISLLYQDLSKEYCELGGQTVMTRRAGKALALMIKDLKTTFGGQEQVRDLEKANLYYKALMALEGAENIVVKAKQAKAASGIHAQKLREQLLICQQALANMSDSAQAAIKVKDKVPSPEVQTRGVDEDLTAIKEEHLLDHEPTVSETITGQAFEQTKDRAEFVDNMVKSLNQEEFRDLCFELEVNYDTLPGSELRSKSRELYLMMERNGRLRELGQRLQAKRPLVSWKV